MRPAIFLLRTSIALAATLAATGAHADPPRTPAVTCKVGGLTAHPKFTQVSPGRAEYNFSGVCTTREGRFLGYRLDATWTPSETHPANANASEVYRIDTLEGPSQSFEVVLGARCERDPWLNNAASCTRVGDNMSDELHKLWPELARSLFPYSRRDIPVDQQDALRAEYARRNGIIDRAQLLADEVTLEGRGAYQAHATQTTTAVADHPYRRVEDADAEPVPPAPAATTEQAVPAAARPTGAEAGIIIVGGKTPYRRVGTTRVDKITSSTIDAGAPERPAEISTQP